MSTVYNFVAQYLMIILLFLPSAILSYMTQWKKLFTLLAAYMLVVVGIVITPNSTYLEVALLPFVWTVFIVLISNNRVSNLLKTKRH